MSENPGADSRGRPLPTSIGLLERPVSFHFLAKGIYEQRRKHGGGGLHRPTCLRITCSADGPFQSASSPFSESQQSEIEQALLRPGHASMMISAADWTPNGSARWTAPICWAAGQEPRKHPGRRNATSLSSAFAMAPAPNGKMLMNFGPNQPKRRRAPAECGFFHARKKHMALVSSIRHPCHHQRLQRRRPAPSSRTYLRYARGLLGGATRPLARRVFCGK